MLNKEGLYREIDVGVTFASLMSATSLFFTGIIIGQYKSFDPSVRVPLIFLIISTCSFIFSATIFSHAGTEVTLDRAKVVEKYITYAKNIEEFLGLYLLMLAIPMVIGAVTKDSFLRFTTSIIALTGITLYSQSTFSSLQKELSVTKKQFLTLLILALSLILYVSQSLVAKNASFVYLVTAILLLAVMILTTVNFSLRSKQYKTIIINEFSENDAQYLSKIILKNIKKYKSSRYSQEAVSAFRDLSSTDEIVALSKTKQIVTATYDHKIVGFVCLERSEISNLFTDPEVHQKGVGRALIDYTESVSGDQ
jgi:hypothetical protein